MRAFTLGGGRCLESTGAATTLYGEAKPAASPRTPLALSSGEIIPETRVKSTVLPGRVVAGSMSTANRYDPSVRINAAAIACPLCVGGWLNPRSAIPHVTTTVVATPSAARSPPCPTIRRVFNTSSHYQIELPILSRPCLLRGPMCSHSGHTTPAPRAGLALTRASAFDLLTAPPRPSARRAFSVILPWHSVVRSFLLHACKVPSRCGNSDAERTTPGLTDPSQSPPARPSNQP